MADPLKYKSISIHIDCYKKIDELTKTLVPGVAISRAQVVRMLVNLANDKYKQEVIEELIHMFQEEIPEEIWPTKLW